MPMPVPGRPNSTEAAVASGSLAIENGHLSSLIADVPLKNGDFQ